MEFTIERDEFYKGLQRAQGIASPKGSIPILANVLIDADGGKVTLFATNLDIGLKGSYDATVATSGRVTVGAKKLHDIVRELPSGPIQLRAEDDRLRVSAGKSRFNLATEPADQFPSFPEYDESNLITLEGGMVNEMIRKTGYAISQDETRLTLNGAFFEVAPDKVRMVATDGHRLAYIHREGAFGVKTPVKAIIARKAIGELSKLAGESEEGLSFLLHDNHVMFRRGSLTLVVRLIEGAFPNYEQVIPKNHQKEARIPKDTFLRALRRVATLADEKSHMVRLTFGDNSLTLASEGGEVGEARDEIDIAYTGDEMVIGLNALYVMDLLGAIDDDTVRFKMQDSLSPVLALAMEDEGQMCIVMPMRL
ncbi:MAG: DNA polymerase III subunit beta [Nitrospinae bacterium]|nr:DNA polymerase III subunit beta [Nitrospinota bacterium]